MYLMKNGFADTRYCGNIALWVLVLLMTFMTQYADLLHSLRYDRQLVAGGSWWLLFSGHLVHANWPHWALNMAGLGIVALFFSRYGSPLQWLWVFLMAALFAGTGVYLFNPALSSGAGLSAVLHGLFVFGALHEIRYHPLSGYILLLLLCGKLAWEFMLGPVTGADTLTGVQVITDAHLYGALGAAVAIAVMWLHARNRHADRAASDAGD